MPGTIEELEAAIIDITSQANSILFLNQNILEEYQARQQKVIIRHSSENNVITLVRCFLLLTIDHTDSCY